MLSMFFLLIVCVFGGTISYLCWRKQELFQNPILNLSISMISGILITIFFISTKEELTPLKGIFVIISTLIITISYLGFIVHLFIYMGTMTIKSLMGDLNLKVKKTYDKIEKAVAEGNLHVAARMYNEEIEKEPIDTEPRKRLADVFLRMGKPDNAIATLKAGLFLLDKVPPSFDKLDTPIEEEMSLLCFRIADIYLKEKNDIKSAKFFLNKISNEFSNTKYAEHAIRRLKRIGV